MSTSNKSQWEQAKAVFTEALERSGQDRIAYLDSACADNPALRAEVESLLRSFDVAGSFMETPAVESAAESLVQQAHLSGGQRVGHYEILSAIGEGGMSEVYLARDLVLGRRVALKILPEYLRNDRERLQRFKQEARTASTLSHPNICVIYEVGETEDHFPFITMEYIEGETLRQRMAESEVNLADVLEIGIQIANALSSAHEAGIVHRDIKPENVIIRRDGYVKVLDFGLAKLTEHRQTADSTVATLMIKSSPGMVLGTTAYMSPEQARGVTVDARSDVWSLGVVLYEMVTGNTPFTGETPTDVVISLVEKEQPPISEFVTDVPAELERILRKALRKDPDERYQLVKEMAIDLRTLQRELQLDRSLSSERHTTSADLYPLNRTDSGKRLVANTERHDALRRTVISKAESPPKWWPRLGMLAVLVVLLGGAFVFYKSFRSDKKSNTPPALFQQVAVTKLTTNGSALYSSISPDGKYVAYVKSESGKESLWLRQVGSTGNIEIIPAREGHYYGIIFAPDGNYIYYAYSDTSDNNEMVTFRVPTLGIGATSVKIKLEEGPATLSHDRKRMAYVRFDPVQKADLLKVYNVDGSSSEKVVAIRKWPNKLSYDFVTRPAWSSDDQVLNLATIVNNNNAGYTINITEFRLSDSSEKTIPLSNKRFESPYHMTVLPDGSGVVFSALAQGASFSQVWLLSRDGTARALTNDLSDYRDADLSADSKSLVTVQRQTLSNIFVSSKPQSNERPAQLTHGIGRYFDLTWAPDGKVLYASDASGDADIYEVSSDGTGTRQLTSRMQRNYAPSVSPDNRYIVFHSNRSGNFQVWRMDRDGSNPIQLTKGSSDSNWPRFSSDSKWIFYEHFEPGVRGSLWKIPVDGGAPISITGTPSLRPVPSPDGKRLAFWESDAGVTSNWHLIVRSLEDGSEKKFDLPPTVKVQWDTLLCWTADSKSVTYLQSKAGVDNLWVQSIDDGSIKQVTNFSDSEIFAFDWSREGQLVSSRGVITNDVVLITDTTH